MIKVAVLGYGTVGSGVVEVLEKNKKEISARAGQELETAYILDLRDFPGDPFEEKVVHDINIILNDEAVKIVCETMGGVGAAYQFTKAALEKGKSVCTSNKELVAMHGPELLEIAKANCCSYLFEASVGGGIPIIRTMRDCLTAEKLESITGILNGTTNYILTKMEREGADYGEVLKQAQDLGYAERNPEADVEGHDTCRKIAILSSLMMGKNVAATEIPTEGITKITSADFEYAHDLGMTIKLLATVKPEGAGQVQAFVAPMLVSAEHPLGMVNDVFNGILVTSDMLGESLYYGRGAGKLPTASAVVADVVDCARHVGESIEYHWENEACQVAGPEAVERRFLVRAKKGTEAILKEAFPGGSVLAIEDREDCGYVTEAVCEKVFYEKYSQLQDAVYNCIRIQ